MKPMNEYSKILGTLKMILSVTEKNLQKLEQVLSVKKELDDIKAVIDRFKHRRQVSVVLMSRHEYWSLMSLQTSSRNIFCSSTDKRSVLLSRKGLRTIWIIKLKKTSIYLCTFARCSGSTLLVFNLLIIKFVTLKSIRHFCQLEVLCCITVCNLRV